jgi:hypothetical protein
VLPLQPLEPGFSSKSIELAAKTTPALSKQKQSDVFIIRNLGVSIDCAQMSEQFPVRGGESSRRLHSRMGATWTHWLSS